jgi:hypothetical protein
MFAKEKEARLGKIRRRRVRWRGSETQDVTGYKLYWAIGGGVDYSSDSAEVGNTTEVVLPDDVLSFPLVSADIELGVTALNAMGNESDMTKFTAPFEFTVPDPPGSLVVESLDEDW